MAAMTASCTTFGITLALVLALGQTISIGNCPSGQFFSIEQKLCVKCSSCPINQIIRLPCGKHKDTQCGPFKEFDKFHQAPQTVDTEDEDWEGGETEGGENSRGALDNSSQNNHHRHHHRQHHGGSHQTQGGKEGEGAVSGGDSDGSVPPRHHSSGLARVGSAAVEGRWKTLALALIGVLCVLSLFLIIFIVVACYIKQRTVVEKEIFLDPDLIAGHDQYVQVRHICSRDRLKTGGGSGQDGEEGSDSEVDSGSLVLAGGRAGGPLLGRQAVLHLSSDDYDADSSAQSTAKSSDYVYFNSPNNANGVP